MDEEIEPYIIVNNMPCACGSDAIMHDVVEDEDVHWCSHCGRQIIYDEQEPEEVEYENQENK